jgi:hypothetical protein
MSALNIFSNRNPLNGNTPAQDEMIRRSYELMKSQEASGQSAQAQPVETKTTTTGVPAKGVKVYRAPANIKVGYVNGGNNNSSDETTSDIAQIYEVLAPMAGDYMNAQAEQIGMAQQSMGPLAANTMGTTTSGLGNYTYNRLMRPQVDTMRDELRVQGYAAQLNKLLSDKLNEARNRYNRSSSGNGNKTSGGKSGSGVTKIDDVEDEEKKGGGKKTGDDNVSSVSTVPSTAKQGEYNVGTATVNGETRIVTKNNKDNSYRISGVGSYRPGSSDWEDAKKKYNVKLNAYPGSNPLLTF